MAIDAALKAFLDLTDGEVPAYAQARAAELGLALPEPTLAAVHENLALLRAQTALFLAAVNERADEPREGFQP